MQPKQTTYEGFPFASAACWPPPPGSNKPGFERKPLDLQRNHSTHYPQINQVNAWAPSVHQDRRTHEEVNATIWLDQVEGASTSQPPLRQAPTDQGVSFHQTHPLPGTAPMNYPAISMASTHTVSAWFPFTENPGSPSNRQAFDPAGHGGINESNRIYSAANQIPREGITFSAHSLVPPPVAQFTSHYGGSESNENGTNYESVQWFEPISGPMYPSRGFDPGCLEAIGEIQSSPGTIPPLSSTASLDAWNHNKVIPLHNETQRRPRRVAPYPAPSGGREESHRKDLKNIPIVSMSEAERVVGPEIRKYYGSKGIHIPDELLWKTRRAIGVESIKKKSACNFCRSECGGSATLYHARRHLNVSPYACPNCACAFAQSSDLKSHIRKIHDKGSLQLPTLPTSNTQLIPAYHG